MFVTLHGAVGASYPSGFCSLDTLVDVFTHKPDSGAKQCHNKGA